MKNESSTTEVVSTTTSMPESMQREKDKPSVASAGVGDTLTRTRTQSEPEPSSSFEKHGQVKESLGDSELPPSLYQESKKPPYLLELFEATEVYNQFNLKPGIDEIDSFIISELTRKGLKDTREGYQKVLDELYEHVKVTDDVYMNIDQLLDWVRIQSKLIQIAKEKEEFEKKPIDEMSAEELRRYIGH